MDAFNKAEQYKHIPTYLRKKYWWAYVHQLALKFWDHPLQINSVLFGNYNKLRRMTLDQIPSGKKVVQLGSCYGSLITHIDERSKSYTVVDCVPEQLQRAKGKSNCDTLLVDARNTGLPGNSAEIVVIFFLLHELPADLKVDVLAEAFRIAGKDGKVVVAEFGKPQ